VRLVEERLAVAYNDLPYLHGPVHRPGGSDPIVPGVWNYVTDPATAWADATGYSAGDIVSHGDFNFLAVGGVGQPPPVVEPVAGIGYVEPEVTDGWAPYWFYWASTWQNGWGTMTATGDIPNPVPGRYRLALGWLNQVDSGGNVTQYNDHVLELQGDLAGGSSDTVVYTIPPAYRLPYDVPVPSHDDTGTYVPCRLLSTGDFVYDTP
jgi:hypothetical protein